MKRFLTLLTALWLFAPSLMAQHKVVADKIVTIVGDKIILRSDVYNEILDKQRRNEPVP